MLDFLKKIKELKVKNIINQNEMKKIKIVKKIRNKVFHHNFIILSKKKDSISINKEVINYLNTIKSLLINKEIHDQFIKDILDTYKKGKSPKYKNNIKLKIAKELKINYQNNQFM